ncbi:MAG: Lrp/AsnC family transcriptional regulator [Pseudomonadota bacterium]
MRSNLDETDRRILSALQKDATLSVDAVAEAAGLSRNAAWRRIRRLDDSGVIRGRVALLDPESLGIGLTVFIAVRTDRHDGEWAETFSQATRSFPEITGVYRTSGELDYLIRAQVRDVKGYDRLYRRLIEKIDLKDVSASFVMEEIKETTALPVG